MIIVFALLDQSWIPSSKTHCLNAPTTPAVFRTDLQGGPKSPRLPWCHGAEWRSSGTTNVGRECNPGTAKVWFTEPRVWRDQSLRDLWNLCVVECAVLSYHSLPVSMFLERIGWIRSSIAGHTPTELLGATKFTRRWVVLAGPDAMSRGLCWGETCCKAGWCKQHLPLWISQLIDYNSSLTRHEYCLIWLIIS